MNEGLSKFMQRDTPHPPQAVPLLPREKAKGVWARLTIKVCDKTHNQLAVAHRCSDFFGKIF